MPNDTMVPVVGSKQPSSGNHKAHNKGTLGGLVLGEPMKRSRVSKLVLCWLTRRAKEMQQP